MTYDLLLPAKGLWMIKGRKSVVCSMLDNINLSSGSHHYVPRLDRGTNSILSDLWT